jgi:D-glycero-alpha-D-manno-heptose 1-phosphate guanylyltransferase
MSEKIINHFGDRYLGMNLIYEVENFPLGTGGAIRVALKNCLADHAFIFNGDTYLDLEVDDLELIWQRNHNPLIVLREVSDTSRFGKVNLDSGRVTDFLEKGIPGPGLINAGCYVLPKNGLDEFPLGQIFSIETDFFNKYLKLIRFDGFVTKGQFIDIGVPKDYFLAQNVLAGL